MKHTFTPETRKWLYGIATAVLVVLGGYGIVSAEEQGNYATLVAAVLNIGGAGVTALAARNVDPEENNTGNSVG